jgi:hypothetical protein
MDLLLWIKKALFLLFLNYAFTIYAAVNNMGYLHAAKEVTLSYNDTSPDNCLEYKFMTNYKKVFFNLVTTPSTDPKYRQRIILSDMQHTVCPQRCSEEPNYCNAISNRIFAQTQATFSKCFPTLYVYIVNLPQPTNLLADFLDSVKDIESSSESNVELVSTFNGKFEGIQNLVEQSSDGTPLFNLYPTHLSQTCKVIDSIVPKCASLPNSDCIDPAFCTLD